MAPIRPPPPWPGSPRSNCLPIARGNVDLEAVRAACDDSIAGIMMTNPNTLGLFEEHIEEVVRLVHGCGGLVYGDGANMNALVGIARPGDLGFDVMHYNLHKTFSTPHGGGGPGSGPVGVSARLKDFLPGPVIECTREKGDARYVLAMPARSIGRVSTFFGNFGMFVRAYAYIRQHGAAGLRANSEHAVLNANYLRVKLRDAFTVPYDRTNMHEFVCPGAIEGTGVRALDVSKRLLDYGFHPPTNYFPLIVPEALMIEPTETESQADARCLCHGHACDRQGGALGPRAGQGRAPRHASQADRRGQGRA